MEFVTWLTVLEKYGNEWDVYRAYREGLLTEDEKDTVSVPKMLLYEMKELRALVLEIRGLVS